MKENIIKIKTLEFAKKIVRVCQGLESKNEYVISKQLKRSGTAPGALVRESEHAESKKDFIHKLSIALKEANETDYWLEVIEDTDYLDETERTILKKDITEIIKILVAIIKTTKASLK